MPPFVQYKPWMEARYGEALFRVPVQLASSCPHGRCTFCPVDGAKAQQIQRRETVRDQIEAAIRFSKRRYRAQKLMLYIQAFTADLTDPDQQRPIRQALADYAFTAVSIGTRPDCLPPAALDFLEELGRGTEVWVEPGVQTACDATLQRIRRGHDWACSRQALLALAERGLFAAPHVILGLPGETADDWNRTAAELARLPLAGIKIHNLHLIRGTELAAEYAREPFPVLNHWEYAEALMEFLRRLPAALPVLRITTDTPEADLIAPHWPLEKGQFLDYLLRQMTLREIRQGDLWDAANPGPATEIKPVVTDDGSITFFSEDWKEHYHTKSGARLEARQKFVAPSGLAERLERGPVRLLDFCFGLGLNSLAALSAAHGAPHRLDITALELDRRAVRASADTFRPLPSDPLDWSGALRRLLDEGRAVSGEHALRIRWGDARFLIQSEADASFDLIYHDAFSTQHCPELWTVELFRQLFRVLKPGGALLTYSSALPVRGALAEAGFLLGETHPGHHLGCGTIAVKQESALRDAVRLEALAGLRAVPYRDPFLCAPSKIILRNRQEAVEIAKP